MRSWIELKDAALVTAAALGFAISFSAGAEPCAVLQYEEMKDMSVQELTQAYCTARNREQENNRAAMDMFSSRVKTASDEAAMRNLDAEASQCTNESERIGRVMVRKGVTTPPADFYGSLCKKG